MKRLLNVAIFTPLMILAGCSDNIEQKPETVPSVLQENNTDDIGATKLAEIRAIAKQGDAEAQYTVGEIYDYGESVQEDYAEAMKWFRLAADQGNAEAQFNLGVMYYFGVSVPKDYAEAMKWFRLAADQGYAEAQNNVGTMYGNGRGVQQNYTEAYTWLSIAAAGGYDAANQNLNIVAEELTPEELSQAQQRATELFEQIESRKK